jgi:hypothetical protein
MITLPAENNLCLTFEQMNINSMFQGLWTQLSVLMRSTIYSTLLSLPSKDAMLEGLFDLPGEFKNAFQMFYGAEISQKFANLFTGFLGSAVQVMEGFKANDQEAIDQGTKGWYQNGHEIAVFLGAINLFWDSRQWSLLMNQYINLQIQMILFISSGEYKKEVEILNRVFDLASIMGSYMARGVIARELQRSK